MIGFLFRKSLYDVWDNMLRLLLVNVGFLALAGATIFLPSLVVGTPVLAVSIFAVGALCVCVYLATVALSVRRISDYGSFGFRDFFANLRQAWPAGLALGFLIVVAALLVTVALPYYLKLKSFFGLLVAATLFWTLVVSLLALQWFLPIRARLDTDLRKVFKKCFIIFFDNSWLSIVCLLNNLVLIVLSSVLAFLLPGPAAAVLFLDEAFRLRLKKYDYMEEHPEADRKKIPWEELLLDDKETTGTRSFRNFFFPWKD